MTAAAAYTPVEWKSFTHRGKLMRVRQVRGKAPDLLYQVREEPLPGGGFRTVSIEGTIRVIPGRLTNGKAACTPFDHSGHLIADIFGGPETVESGNILAMHGVANAGAGGEYRRMERTVEKFLGDRDGWMKVEVGYKEPTDTRPHAFDVTVRYANGMHARWKIFNFNHRYPNPHLSKK